SDASAERRAPPARGGAGSGRRARRPAGPRGAGDRPGYRARVRPDLRAGNTGETRMRGTRATRWAILAVAGLGAAGCLSRPPAEVPEYIGRGPRAEEMFFARVAQRSDREPS